MMLTHKSYSATDGYTRILTPGELGITKLHFGILNLAPEATFFGHSDDTEVALIALGGHCILLVGHNGNKANGILGERPDVFRGDACMAYIPHHTTYEIFAGEIGVEIAVCKTASDMDVPAVIFAAGESDAQTDYQLNIRENDMSVVSGCEAVCFYRFADAEGCATVELASLTQATKRVVLRHNDVLVLPSSHRARALSHEGVCYQLCVVCPTLLQSVLPPF